MPTPGEAGQSRAGQDVRAGTECISTHVGHMPWAGQQHYVEDAGTATRNGIGNGFGLGLSPCEMELIFCMLRPHGAKC